MSNAMEKYKIQQIEDRSEIGDISVMYTKFKIIKKEILIKHIFCKERQDKLIRGHANVMD